MRTIAKRLEALEKLFPPRVEEDAWGSMAALREALLRDEKRGDSFVTELKEQLDAIGPMGLWCEVLRIHLQNHASIRSDESLAEATARALGIGMEELQASISEGSLGSKLAEL